MWQVSCAALVNANKKSVSENTSDVSGRKRITRIHLYTKQDSNLLDDNDNSRRQVSILSHGVEITIKQQRRKRCSDHSKFSYLLTIKLTWTLHSALGL